jgi:hypothetical protein
MAVVSGIKPLRLGDMLKASQHQQRINEDRANTVATDPSFGHLSSFQVSAMESMLESKKISADLPFVIELYQGGASVMDLWRMCANSHWDTHGVRDGFALVLNALLCDEGTKDSIFATVSEGLIKSDELISNSMRALVYYSDKFGSSVLDKLNQCRMLDGSFISDEAISAFSRHGLSYILFKSAARNEDVQGFHYLLKHTMYEGGGQTMLRNSSRAVNAPKSFIKAVLGAHEAVSAFAHDIVETVKTAKISRLDEIYDQPLVEQCIKEVFHELMDLCSLSEPQIKAAQHFMGRVITSGADTYGAFLAEGYHPFEVVDLLKQPRMTPHQMIDRVLRLYTQSAGNLDVFLLGLDLKDIHTHPEAVKCFERLHKLTGDEQYLKYSSTTYKSKSLEDALGL